MKDPGMYRPVGAWHLRRWVKGRFAQATETYQALEKIDTQGRSLMTSGLSDLAIYQGRFSQAARMLTQGAAADLATKDPDRAAAKFAALGYALIQQGRKGPAIEAAAQALASSRTVKTRFQAARIIRRGR